MPLPPPAQGTKQAQGKRRLSSAEFKCSSRVNHPSTGWNTPKDSESICNLGTEKNVLLFQEQQAVVTEPKLYCFQ